MKTLLKILFREHWKKISLIVILTFINVQCQLFVIEFLPVILIFIKEGVFSSGLEIMWGIFIAIAFSIISILFVSYLSASSNFASNLKERLFSIVMNINTLDDYSKINFSGLMTRLIRGVDTEQSLF